MNFSEAWAELIAGRSIRRQSWDKGYYWFLLDGNPLESDPAERHIPYSFGCVDVDELMATDWEIY